MRVIKLDTYMTNAGYRNYLFVRIETDDGISGIGEASLEWQEKTVETLLHEWIEGRIIGIDPYDIELVVEHLIRDQYQGGSTIMTAISSIEIALWDIIGKATGQPVYKLLGGQHHDDLLAYANGWYGGASTPEAFAGKAKDAVSKGYKGLKFDPFGVAWQKMTEEEMAFAEEIVAAVRQAVGDDVFLMIEAHGRLSPDYAIEIGKRLERYNIYWYEEPVISNEIEQLREIKTALKIPVAAGERLYSLPEFNRLLSLKAVDVVQMDPSHCGGLLLSRKIAQFAQKNGIKVSPHCSIGPVALCAALHFDWATPDFIIQENFSEYDVPWRNELVFGWNPIKNGRFKLPETPGLGIELNTEICAAHPYKKLAFPSLWDKTWLSGFTQKDNK